MKRILPLLAAMIALTTVLPGKAQTGKYYIDSRETTREELLKLPAGTIESMANSVENGLPVVRIKLKPEGGEQAPATGQQEKNTATPHEKAMQLVRGIYEQHTLLKEGDLAADFRATKYAGGDLTLTALRGKVVLLNFWATWCGPCKSELPAFNSIYEKYKDSVVFLMINLTDNGDTVSRVKEFVSDNGYSFPVYYDVKHNAAAAYGVYSIPETVFINADGTLYGMRVGAMSESVLESHIKQIIRSKE